MSTDTHCAIFVCQQKLMEHDVQYRKFYNDHSAPAMIRQSLAKLSGAIAKATKSELAYLNDNFKELFHVESKDGSVIKTTMSSAKPTCIKTCSIRNPSTFDYYNKLCSFIYSSFDEVHANAITGYLDSLIKLTQKGYVFECYIEPTFMSLSLESTRSKLNVDVTIERV